MGAILGAYGPAMAMIGLQFSYAGVALLSRAALLHGLSPRVFVVYRQGIAALLMTPLACLSRRRSSHQPALGLRGFAWIFAATVIGVTANQNAYFEGLYLSSSTAASAMTNMIPAITFVMATLCGLEKVNIRSMRSIVKILGTTVCVSGAISMALVKGPKLLNMELATLKSLFSTGNGENWLLGCLFLFGSSCAWSSWMIFQVPISKSCPDHIYSSALMCCFATSQSILIAIFTEREIGAWVPNGHLEISSCLYAGTALALSFFFQAWVISQRGPLYAALFNPLCTVIVTFFAAIFLHEETYTGSMLGALAVIAGLYLVLWGKAKEVQDNIKTDMHMKLETDNSNILQISIDEPSETITRKPDFEEPLLSLESSEVDENYAKP